MESQAGQRVDTGASSPSPLAEDAGSPQMMVGEGSVEWPGMQNSARQQAQAEVRKKIKAGYSLMEDMGRLHSAWTNNVLTETKTALQGQVTQPLTITLRSDQIEALLALYGYLSHAESRLRGIKYEVQNALDMTAGIGR